MQSSLIDQIAEAVLYEGYLLYPYRPGVKNTQRWTFGGLFPPAYSATAPGNESSAMQVQCLVKGETYSTVEITLRFLQLVNRRIGRPQQPLPSSADLGGGHYTFVDHATVAGQEWYSWQEAIERQVALCRLSPRECACFRGAKADSDHPHFTVGELAAEPHRMEFAFDCERQIEPVCDDNQNITAVIVRERESLMGAIEVAAERVATDGFRLTVRAVNETAYEPAAAGSRDEALLRSFASAHLALAAQGGAFVSQIDPPERWQSLTAQNRNIGAWPVLVGDPTERNRMLAAPIILYDYPRIAAQSPGVLFDSTEIDEILTLRIMTLCEDEKRAMESLDPRGRELLRRVESLPQETMLQLHGKM